MPDVRLRLSGNVSQTISPWTWMFNPVGSQIGGLNVDVDLGSSADPETEEAMLADVGSYGRQLGRIGDALLVLINHVHLDNLTQTEREALATLRDQLGRVDETKTRIASQRGTVREAAPAPSAPAPSAPAPSAAAQSAPARPTPPQGAPTQPAAAKPSTTVGTLPPKREASKGRSKT